jgi:hypothetical protein
MLPVALKVLTVTTPGAVVNAHDQVDFRMRIEHGNHFARRVPQSAPIDAHDQLGLRRRFAQSHGT